MEDFPPWHVAIAQAVIESFVPDGDERKEFRIAVHVNAGAGFGLEEWMSVDLNWTSLRKWYEIINACSNFFVNTWDWVPHEERKIRAASAILERLECPLPIHNIEAAAILHEWQSKRMVSK